MIPRRVTSVGEGRLRIREGERERDVVAGPDVAGVAVGGYVLVYANVAILKVAEEEALEHLRFLAQLGEGTVEGGAGAG